MIYNKNNLLISPVASKSEVRKELTGVLFKKDRTVATDSYKLIEVKNVEKYQKLASEYPQLPDKVKPINNFSKAGYIIPAKSVAKVLRNLIEVKNDTLPVLNNCIFANTSEPDKTSRIATTDLERADIVSVNNIKGKYPDYEQIIPNTNKGGFTKTTINVKYLKEVVDILAKMDHRRAGVDEIDIYTNNDEKPLVIKMAGAMGQEITALIMPFKK